MQAQVRTTRLKVADTELRTNRGQAATDTVAGTGKLVKPGSGSHMAAVADEKLERCMHLMHLKVEGLGCEVWIFRYGIECLESGV